MKALVGTANLLAGQAVAHAAGFLEGRHNARELAGASHALIGELRRLKGLSLDLPTTSIADAAFILAIAARNTAAAHLTVASDGNLARAKRWRQLLASLVEHVRKESLALTEEGYFA